MLFKQGSRKHIVRRCLVISFTFYSKFEHCLSRLGLGSLQISFRQVNFSELAPGAIKAFHLHVRQTDVWYVPPGDRMLIVLLDVRQGSPSEGARMRFVLGDGASRLLRIQPGVAHGVRNVGTQPARIVYFTDVHFSAEPSSCDEGRLPWDFAGAELWDITRG